MDVVADRTVRVRLPISDRMIEYFMIVHGTDHSILHHFSEIIGQRVVVAHVVVLL